MFAVTAGIGLFLTRSRIAAVQATFPRTPTAEDLYHRSMRGIDRLSVETTARTQRGSLSIYLGTILVVFVCMALFALLRIQH